jgi:hypothetical protein
VRLAGDLLGWPPAVTLLVGYFFFTTSFAAPFSAPLATFLAAAPTGPQPSPSFCVGVVVGSFCAAAGFAVPFFFLVLVIFLVFLTIGLNCTPFHTTEVYLFVLDTKNTEAVTHTCPEKRPLTDP